MVGALPPANEGAPTARAGPRLEDRMAVTMITTTPAPMRTSPMLKTFVAGNHAGRAKMSVSQGRFGLATNDEFE